MSKLFIGRQSELQRLEDLLSSGRASLVAIKGRRRIGKSRLAQEFGRGKIYLPFSGIPPVDGVSAQDQRDVFARQLAHHFQLPPMTFTDWSDAFAHLSRYLTNEPTVLLFDEISWMGSKDPTFIPKLKNWWDLVLQNQSHLIWILCGSISTWIDENIINSTAFFGRISLYLELRELSLSLSYEMLNNIGFKGSERDVYKILSLTGGVPWYLEQIQRNQSADENIKRLAFIRGGVLVDEFNRIFHDLFSSRGEIFKKIVHVLAKKSCDRNEIRQSTHYSKSGSLSTHLSTLETSGYINKDPIWSFKTGKAGKKSLYRLSDNYLRFYLRSIEPNLSKIAKDAFVDAPISSLPAWESIMGLQIETLLLNNRSRFYKALGIYPQDIVADGPYQQKANTKHKGCQIDYLVQTRMNTLYACEIKVQTKSLGVEVIDEMVKKFEALSLPKGFGFCPVLLYLGPISDVLQSQNYFYRMIDIADFLQKTSQK
jgi:hypothetical protein